VVLWRALKCPGSTTVYLCLAGGLMVVVVRRLLVPTLTRELQIRGCKEAKVACVDTVGCVDIGTLWHIQGLSSLQCTCFLSALSASLQTLLGGCWLVSPLVTRVTAVARHGGGGGESGAAGVWLHATMQIFHVLHTAVDLLLWQLSIAGKGCGVVLHTGVNAICAECCGEVCALPGGDGTHACLDLVPPVLSVFSSHIASLLQIHGPHGCVGSLPACNAEHVVVCDLTPAA
jgi:hypothetical protein